MPSRICRAKKFISREKVLAIAGIVLVVAGIVLAVAGWSICVEIAMHFIKKSRDALLGDT